MSASSTAGRIGVWGRSGSGKSSYAKRLLGKRKRVIVFDPLDEYRKEGGGFRRTPGHSLEAVRTSMRDDWAGFRLAYVPPSGQEARALSALCNLLKAAQGPFFEGQGGAQMTLVVEEMNLSFPVAGGDAKCPGFAEVCSRGRHYGIEVVGLSQRLAEVSTRFRGNCTETVIFAQKGPRDIKAAMDEIGGLKPPVENLQYVVEKSGTIRRGTITFGKPAKRAANRNVAPSKGRQKRA